MLVPVSGYPHQPVRQPVVSHTLHFLCLGVTLQQVRSPTITVLPPSPSNTISSRILDSFLCEGREVLFRLALTLLMLAKCELLQKDIEGVTKVVLLILIIIL